MKSVYYIDFFVNSLNTVYTVIDGGFFTHEAFINGEDARMSDSY